MVLGYLESNVQYAKFNILCREFDILIPFKPYFSNFITEIELMSPELTLVHNYVFLFL